VIVQTLHTNAVGLDTVKHRDLKLNLPVQDWRFTDKLNALFVTVTEFADACREFPLVFVNAGEEADGSMAIAPIAVFGVTQGDNLFVTTGRWRGRYMPTVLRLYPFCVTRMDQDRMALCVDMNYSGADDAQGLRVFNEDGTPSELLKGVQAQLETMEADVQKTRMACKRLKELDLLREMRFDATLPGGRSHSVDGFMVVDEEKLANLPEAAVVELHRSGILGLVHLHWLSMRNMHPLLEWHVERVAATEQNKAA
jgi:SapC